MIFIEYLFYRLYDFNSRTELRDMAQVVSILITACLLEINIIQIDAILAKADVMPSILANRYIVAILFLTLSFVLGFYFLWKRRYRVIIHKFESDDSSKRGSRNVLFIAYLIITFASIFIVGKYKPGYLPSL